MLEAPTARAIYQVRIGEIAQGERQVMDARLLTRTA
jgi:hypothetical protein